MARIKVPTLSRAGFEFIAGILKESKPINEPGFRPDPGELAGWELTALRFARELGATNPRFDRARFEAACGLAGEPANGGRS